MMEQQQPWPRFSEAQAVSEELWLLGQPRLRDYLDFVEDTVVDGATADRVVLTNEWRVANDYYHELEQQEVGIADQIECDELDSGFEPLTAEVMAHAHYRRCFDTLPTHFGMVDLDRLVLFQKHVNRHFVMSLTMQLGPAPTPEALFRFCFPLGHPDTPVQIQRVGSRRYVFRSESTDFRFHEPALLQPEQIHNYDAFGAVAGVVGLVVGFGSNFLNAIRVGKRLMLHNGYHRACALRALGITRAPCLIQTVTRMDELEISAKQTVVETPDFYFKTARPPLLKDFFDPKIAKVLPVYRRVRMIEVNFEVRDYLLPQ